MHLYGKTILKERLDNIAKQDRLPHAILLYGDYGIGKRTMANYIAKLFVCSAPPCDNCNNCSRIDNFSHPDVMYVKRECGGKYTLSEDAKNSLVSLRKITESTVIKPNDGDVKVYIFEDCDDMTPNIQNTLLKLIEEPAPFLRFVFTCENTDSILETIRSRVTEFEVPTATVEECAKCLIDKGYPPDSSRDLADTLSGNIGKCLDVLSGEGDTPYMDTAKRVAAALANKDSFSCATALTEQTGRAEFSSVLNYLIGILRDALTIRCGGSALTSCGKAEAQTIAKVFSEEKLLSMLDSIFNVSQDASLNLNMALTVSYLTSKLL